MGHLHLDHAGGLEHLVDTDVPIYIHEEEFKLTCWAVATKADLNVYLGQYMLLQKLRWKTSAESRADLFQGMCYTIRRSYTGAVHNAGKKRWDVFLDE